MRGSFIGAERGGVFIHPGCEADAVRKIQPEKPHRILRRRAEGAFQSQVRCRAQPQQRQIMGGLGGQAEKQRSQKRVIQIHGSTIGIGVAVDKQIPPTTPPTRLRIGFSLASWILCRPKVFPHSERGQFHFSRPPGSALARVQVSRRFGKPARGCGVACFFLVTFRATAYRSSRFLQGRERATPRIRTKSLAGHGGWRPRSLTPARGLA